jgi:hypothetical protein
MAYNNCKVLQRSSGENVCVQRVCAGAQLDSELVKGRRKLDAGGRTKSGEPGCGRWVVAVNDSRSRFTVVQTARVGLVALAWNSLLESRVTGGGVERSRCGVKGSEKRHVVHCTCCTAPVESLGSGMQCFAGPLVHGAVHAGLGTR